jgi:2-polyprenyl-6-methoxyphenol hydroxylase-like FAD-dependent oxidoreductase
MAAYQGRAGVVGGGIGGLTAAIALRAAGWDVTVYERAAKFTEVGAVMALSSNALAALDAIGVGASIRAAAVRDRPGGVRNQHGRDLATGRINDLTGGDDLVLLHRADLVAALADALPWHCLRPGTTVTRVDSSGEIEIAGSGTTRYDLVVAADGVHSAIRGRLWPEADPVRRTGITVWRWIVDTPPAEFAGAVLGERAEIGILPMAGDRTYMYAGARSGIEDLAHFADWAAPVPALVALADPDRVVKEELLEIRVPKTLARGRVVLIGDAAHAMRPTLGQGASLAIEDAVTLAAYAPDLAGYSTARRRRVRTISWLSRRGSLVTEPGSKILAAVRDTVTGLMPNRLVIWAARTAMRVLITKWRPPLALR